MSDKELELVDDYLELNEMINTNYFNNLIDEVFNEVSKEDDKNEESK
jgi:hypothetical protein